MFYHFVICDEEGFELGAASMNGPNEKRSVEENEKSSDDDKPSYYYDDAHGYEEYDPRKDAEEKDDEEFDD